MFYGSIPALITPFKDGEIDWPAFEKFVEWQIEQGSHALLPCGTTGESPTLSHDEHNALVERCVQIVNKRIPVMAGAGSNATKEAIELTQHAKDSGADAVLSIVPYYNKPTQDGLYAHFKAIHDAVDIPLILYNVPGRTVADMSNETVGRLAALPRIIGIKDASGDLSRPLEIARLAGKDFCQLSGDDITAAAHLAQGGVGVVSVVANVAPAMVAHMQNAWRDNDFETVNTLRDRLGPLADDAFCESSPSPIKYAASTLGLCGEEVRLPLLPASQAARDKIDRALEYAGVDAKQMDAA